MAEMIKQLEKRKILTETHDCQITDLGLIDYQKAYDFQKKCVMEVISGAPQRIILCEHPAVITFGRLAQKENLLIPAEELKKRNIQSFHIDRGGDITLHAPGQLIVYPILNLNNYGRDLKAYLHKLEQVAIDFLKGFDIVANRIFGKTGVYVDGRKIVSMGIGVKKWVSFHGLGINVNTDLSLFSLMRPCGLDVKMTSVSQLLHQSVLMSDAQQKWLEVFAQHFQLEYNDE